MRAVVQRVTSARVTVSEEVVGSIGRGLLVYLGVGTDDGEPDRDWMVEKLPNLRIFGDEAGAMNRSLLEVGGGLLIVSQFTLLADARKGRRPSFSAAADPEKARVLYERLCGDLEARWGIRVERGRFQADMLVASENDGPVTILLDSKRGF